MKIYTTSEQVARARLPTATKAAVLEAVRNLEELFGEGFNKDERGYVALVEKDDTPETVKDHLGRLLFGMPIEGVFVRHRCLLALTIWGNGGEGITWVCPDEEDYSLAIRRMLREEMI